MVSNSIVEHGPGRAAAEASASDWQRDVAGEISHGVAGLSVLKSEDVARVRAASLEYAQESGLDAEAGARVQADALARAQEDARRFYVAPDAWNDLRQFTRAHGVGSVSQDFREEGGPALFSSLIGARGPVHSVVVGGGGGTGYVERPAVSAAGVPSAPAVARDPVAAPKGAPLAAPADEAETAAYAALAAEVGFAPPDLRANQFRAFLHRKDWPVYAISAVSAYMDDKALRASAAEKNDGWFWRPLRARDVRAGWRFGVRGRTGYGNDVRASGYYCGADREAAPYDKLVPAHALRKVAAIEKEFGKDVAFFVCDYLSTNPDPFLMACLDGPGSAPICSVVIDFWDEPGFGLDAQLK